MSEPIDPATRISARRPWYLLSGFAVGFIVVFVLAAWNMRVHYPHRSGEFVVDCSLGRYYVVVFNHILGEPDRLGMRAGSSTAVLSYLLPHLILSLGGGVIGMVLGGAVRKMRTRRTS